MADTTIEWTDKTWNPIVGCKVISPGCANCYAMRMAARLEAMGQDKYRGLTQPSKAGAVWTGRFAIDREAMLEPFRWRGPKRIFANSMGDPFLAGVPFEAVDQMMAVITMTPQHDYVVLTKRPDLMADYMLKSADGLSRRDHVEKQCAWLRLGAIGDRADLWTADGQGGSTLAPWPLPNLWLGTSVENRDQLHRIDALRQAPAAVRVVSFEPLLEDIGPVDLTGIHWVIVGGESGQGARPLHPDWVRDLRDQCIAQGVGFFFKQWGAWRVIYDRDVDDPDWRRTGDIAQANPKGRWLNLQGGHGFHGDRVVYVAPASKASSGRMLDGRLWSEGPRASTRAAA